MKFLDRLLGRKAAQLTYEQVANLIDGGSGGMIAGVHVNDKTALQVSTVLSCVKVIADGCATPDMHVYRQKPDGTRELATNIPEYRLLNRRPNEWQTSFEWRRMMTVHAELTGSALSIKVRGNNGRVRELIPIEPGKWDVRKVSRYELRYRCWDEYGMIGDFKSDDVFLLNGLQWEWAKSLDAVKLAQAAIGLSIATERSMQSMHANGLKSSGTYSVDGPLTAEQHSRITGWLKSMSGPDKAGSAIVLDRGAKWLQTGSSAVDAQSNETRRMQVEEICRCYGVFPIMVGHSDKSATFASTESFFGAHKIHTLAPRQKAWTQRIDEMLLDGAGPLFAGFDNRYMTLGSMNDRSQYARTMIELGLLSPNEWRDMEGLDPRPGGDEYLKPLNMDSGTTPKGNEDEQQPKSPIEIDQ